MVDWMAQLTQHFWQNRNHGDTSSTPRANLERRHSKNIYRHYSLGSV